MNLRPTDELGQAMVLMNCSYLRAPTIRRHTCSASILTGKGQTTLQRGKGEPLSLDAQQSQDSNSENLWPFDNHETSPPESCARGKIASHGGLKDDSRIRHCLFWNSRAGRRRMPSKSGSYPKMTYWQIHARRFYLSNSFSRHDWAGTVGIVLTSRH